VTLISVTPVPIHGPCCSPDSNRLRTTNLNASRPPKSAFYFQSIKHQKILHTIKTYPQLSETLTFTMTSNTVLPRLPFSAPFSTIMSQNWKVIFILGGPGSGKTNQCQILAYEYRFCHLDIGDILRAEVARPDSRYAAIIEKNMKAGRIGPPEITVPLLKAAMREKAENEGETVFLIDGKSVPLRIHFG
jgi:hypothetical protein